jgi:DNA-directed RNA polymerase specialized sigma24 family protein
MCAAMVLPFRKKEESPLTKELLRKIEKSCKQVARGDAGDRKIHYENLYDAVIDKLMADDFRRLRKAAQDNENGEITDAWLNMVITRTSVDLFRKGHGRNDWSHLEGMPKLICKLHYNFKYPEDEIKTLIHNHAGSEITLPEIRLVIADNARKSTYNPDEAGEAVTIYDEENNMTTEVIDRTTADTILERIAQNHEEELTIKLFLMRLDSSDKLLISYHFGLDGEKLKMKEIAAIVDDSVTALQKRKDKIIEEFYTWLSKQKLSLDDLIMQQVARSAS